MSFEQDDTDEFQELYESLDKEYHEYLTSVLKNPIRQFQKSTVDEYLKLIKEKGLPVAASKAIDSRDYTKGNSWEQAEMNVMNSIIPPGKLLNKLLRQGVEDGNHVAVKWFPEVSGNPKEITEVLSDVVKQGKESSWWAAIHLSRHAPDTDGIVEALTSGMDAEWIAFKLEHSSTGITGRGECAKALARLGDKAKEAQDDLRKQLESDSTDAADASHIAGALFQLSKDVKMVLNGLAKVAERVLTEKRGVDLHAGDREMLHSLKNLIKKWREEGGEGDDNELKEKVEMLERELEYHLQ